VQTGLGQWYDSHADQLADSFTKDKMLRYAGEFCIGTMIDLDQIPKLAAAELSGAQLIT
jgi:hypothetical protein